MGMRWLHRRALAALVVAAAAACPSERPRAARVDAAPAVAPPLPLGDIPTYPPPPPISLDGYPPVPFIVRSKQPTAIFPDSDIDEAHVDVPVGTLATVTAPAHVEVWQGQRGGLVHADLDEYQHVYAFLPHWEVAAPGEALSIADAGRLLAAPVPAARRAWCAGWTARMVIDRAASRFLVWSHAPDSDCLGYVGVVRGVGEHAHLEARTRLGTLLDVKVHRPVGQPPLVELVEQRTARALTLQRTVFLSLGTPPLRELLAFDRFRDEETPAGHVNARADVSVTDDETGLRVRVERHTTLSAGRDGGATGTIELQGYRYVDGKLVEAAPPAAPATPPADPPPATRPVAPAPVPPPPVRPPPGAPLRTE